MLGSTEPRSSRSRTAFGARRRSAASTAGSTRSAGNLPPTLNRSTIAGTGIWPSAMLQTIMGRIEVHDDHVRVELGLPRLLHIAATATAALNATAPRSSKARRRANPTVCGGSQELVLQSVPAQSRRSRPRRIDPALPREPAVARGSISRCCRSAAALACWCHGDVQCERSWTPRACRRWVFW
jgi:hypothetical protein